MPSQRKDKATNASEGIDTKVYLIVGCLLLSVAIRCLVEGLSDEDNAQLMDKIMTELMSVVPEDRNSFTDMCITRKEKCTDDMFNGKMALFSWQAGIDEQTKHRFWKTYECVYMKQLEICPVDGGWTEWSPWSKCDADCEDKGQQVRTRSCENPKPSFGGDSCDGLAFQNRSCVGLCTGNADGQEEAREYIKQIHAVFPDLKEVCIEKHCLYEEVEQTVKDKSKVDKYWSSLSCVKYGGACPINGGWSMWEEWSECSIGCGVGHVYRMRKCDKPTPKNGGIVCQGDYYNSKGCLSRQCSADVTFSDWSEFSSCSESCGKYGLKTSTRVCINQRYCTFGDQTTNEIVKSVPCYGGPCPQNGGWGKWLSWSACSAKCGTGRRTRMRRCDTPPAINGEDCPGPRTHVAACEGSFCKGPAESNDNSEPDDSIVATTTVAVNADVADVVAAADDDDDDDDDGLKRRRSADQSELSWQEGNPLHAHKTFVPEPKHSEGSYSDSYLPFVNKYNSSNMIEDIVDGKPSQETASAFHEINIQSHNQGGTSWGSLLKVRSADGFKIESNSTYKGRKLLAAEGNSSAKAPQIDEDDPLNIPFNPDLEPLYTDWSPWTKCSASCGGGTRTRKRTCKDSKSECRGEVQPIQFCNMDPCPVLGGWGPWQGWTPCSVTCGTGKSERYRACDSPLPTHGGSCAGVNSQTQPCRMPACPVEKSGANSWGSWTMWIGCSVTCGGGTRTRQRFREATDEKTTEAAVCNTEPCAEKGMWAAWGTWSSCNQPCGLGHTYRDRTCTDPAPMFGGDPCDGPGSEADTCYGGPCADEDDYGVLLRGNGYLRYLKMGKNTGFLMVFMRIKPLLPSGTLFHHTRKCRGRKLTNCEISILATLSGGLVALSARVNRDRKPLKLQSTSTLTMRKWQDVYVLVTEGWAEMRINDNPRIEKAFKKRLHDPISFDGVLTVGANRRNLKGFHGKIGALRKNFKVLLLFSMKGWSGYGTPDAVSNTRKVPLSSAIRHPDFNGIYYSHLLFRETRFLEVTVVFQLTGTDGLLFFNGGKGPRTFVSVTIQDGALQFCLNCGDKSVCRKAYDLKIGKWYILRVSAKGNEGEIRMNDGDAMQLNCPVGQEYLPRSSLYVGGAGEKDLAVILELTKNDVFFHGMIDALFIGGVAVTYKMATLVDKHHGINSLGYSLSDHVTEVYEHKRAITTLRCGVTQKIKRDHLVKIIWFQDMKRLPSGVGTEIIDSESVNKSVSVVNLHSTHHSEGVYACVLSKDGILVVLHVFILLHYASAPTVGTEARAEWIIFIILLVLLLILAPILFYVCTKEHPAWEKIRKLFRKKAPKQNEEQKGLIDSEATSGTDSVAETSEDESAAEGSSQEVSSTDELAAFGMAAPSAHEGAPSQQNAQRGVYEETVSPSRNYVPPSHSGVPSASTTAALSRGPPLQKRFYKTPSTHKATSSIDRATSATYPGTAVSQERVATLDAATSAFQDFDSSGGGPALGMAAPPQTASYCRIPIPPQTAVYCRLPTLPPNAVYCRLPTPPQTASYCRIPTPPQIAAYAKIPTPPQTASYCRIPTPPQIAAYSRIPTPPQYPPQTASSYGMATPPQKIADNTDIQKYPSMQAPYEEPPIQQEAASFQNTTFQRNDAHLQGVAAREASRPSPPANYGDSRRNVHELVSQALAGRDLDPRRQAAPHCSKTEPMSYAEQISLKMPPRQYYQLKESEDCPQSDSCNPHPFDIDYRQYHTLCKPEPPPECIKPVDLLRNPYFVSGLLRHCPKNPCKNSNQSWNNSASDFNCNYSEVDFSSQILCDKLMISASENSSQTSLGLEDTTYPRNNSHENSKRAEGHSKGLSVNEGTPTICKHHTKRKADKNKTPSNAAKCEEIHCKMKAFRKDDINDSSVGLSKCNEDSCNMVSGKITIDSKIEDKGFRERGVTDKTIKRPHKNAKDTLSCSSQKWRKDQQCSQYLNQYSPCPSPSLIIKPCKDVKSLKPFHKRCLKDQEETIRTSFSDYEVIRNLKQGGTSTTVTVSDTYAFSGKQEHILTELDVAETENYQCSKSVSGFTGQERDSHNNSEETGRSEVEFHPSPLSVLSRSHALRLRPTPLPGESSAQEAAQLKITESGQLFQIRGDKIIVKKLTGPPRPKGDG